MTIATGFHFDDGLLFCVDTKVSSDIKTNEPKLLFHTHGEGNPCATVFAMSSADLNFPRSAIQSCVGAVDKIDFSRATIESIRTVIQSELLNFYREHIFPHPDRSAVYLELLVGIWLRGESRLFASHETLLNSVKDYECLGSGAYLAKYLIRQYWNANREPTSLDDVALIASLAVQSAIDYDEGCGGEPDMLIVNSKGEVESGWRTDIYPDGDFSKQLLNHVWRLLHNLAVAGGDNMQSQTDELLERYFDEIRNLNSQFKWWFDLKKSKG